MGLQFASTVFGTPRLPISLSLTLSKKTNASSCSHQTDLDPNRIVVPIVQSLAECIGRSQTVGAVWRPYGPATRSPNTHLGLGYPW